MKKIMLLTIIILTFNYCKKHNNENAIETPKQEKTFNLYKTLFVWDSLRMDTANLNNYKFKITIFNNNSIDKIIYSNRNKIKFTNFKLGKYDMLIEDSLGIFSKFRDTVVLGEDIMPINYLSSKTNVVELIKHPSFNLTSHSVLTNTASIFFRIDYGGVTKPYSYIVYFNRKNNFNDTSIIRLKDRDFDGPPFDGSYWLQALIEGTGPNAYNGFHVYPQIFKQSFNYSSGDSIYFFVLPASRQYYYMSYIRNYNSTKSMKKNGNDLFFTATNINKIYTIPYKFN